MRANLIIWRQSIISIKTKWLSAIVPSTPHRGKKNPAQGSALGRWSVRYSPCKGKIVYFQCFFPCRAKVILHHLPRALPRAKSLLPFGASFLQVWSIFSWNPSLGILLSPFLHRWSRKSSFLTSSPHFYTPFLWPFRKKHLLLWRESIIFPFLFACS